MELLLSEDQELLRSTTRAFLDAVCPLSTVRSLADALLGYDPEHWLRGAELGWTSMLVDEADGGGSVSGSGLTDLALVAEERGRSVAAGPFVPSNVVAAGLGSWADVAQRRSVLDELLAGKATGAWTAVGLGDPGTVTILDEVGAGELIVDGEVSPVEGGPGAAWLLVAARDGDGITQVIVPASAPGVTIEPFDGLDLVRRFGCVGFDEVAVPRSAVVGVRGDAGADVGRLLNIAVVLQCAETVGALTEIFYRTIEYLGDRYSFGRPLASYQALKHRCADWELELQRCNATATAATRAVARQAGDADELVSVAKAYIGPVATEMVQDCIQLHGGIGVTWDHDLHLYLRRVTVNRATYGSPDEHLARIADAVFASAS